MKTSKIKRPAKKVIIILVIVLLIIGSLAFLYSLRNDSAPETQNTQDTEEFPRPSTETPDNDKQLVPDETIPQTGNPNATSNPNVEISVPNYQINGNGLNVNVAINAPWGDDAICTMKLSGAQSTTVTANVFAQAQISGCQLEVSNLRSGEYVVNIYAERNSSRTNELKLNISI